MKSIYDLVKVSRKPVDKPYVSKKASIVKGLKENISLLEKRGSIDLVSMKSANGEPIKPKENSKAVLTERNQWWSKPDKKDGKVRIRIECKGKRVYFDREYCEKNLLFECGSSKDEVINTFKILLNWVEENMEENTQLFYWSRRSVSIEKDGRMISVKQGEKFIATM